MLRGVEALESRNLMAGELLEIRLDALALDGVTPITSINKGQEFLLRGRADDLRSNAQGAFQVYTDIAHQSVEVTPMISEVQRLDFTGDPTGGTFTLTYQGVSSGPIPFNPFSQGPVQAKAIQDGLERIPALDGRVRVDQDRSFSLSLPENRYFIRFINNLANTDVAQLVPNGAGLTSDPGGSAGVAITEFAKGLRSNTEAFRQAFVYNSRTDGVNLVTEDYPDNRQGADVQNLYDNVGGGAQLFSPPGSSFTTYFLLRARAVDGGADGLLTFGNDLANESGLEIYLFGQDDALRRDQILFTYGGDNPSSGRLEIVVNTSVRAVDDTGYTVREDSTGVVLNPSPVANDVQTPPTPRTLRITGVSAGSDGGTLTIINSGADVRYRPAANFFGTETFTYTVQDADGNSSVGDISITVNPVNDAPSFTKGPDVTVNEDAPLQTIAGWATAISPGPREGGQTLTFDITSNNDALFETFPTISANGTLSFKPASNRSGTAFLTVTLRDNGGTANGGVNASPSQTFRIIVRAINDAPVNRVPGPQTTTGTAPVTFTGATALSIIDVDAGAGDLFTTLSVNGGRLQIGGTIGAGLLITGNNTGTVTLTGTRTEINNALSTVTYRANNGFTGADTLTMVTDDQGNTGLGGAKSDTDTVQITVQAPAEPTAVEDTASAVEDGPAITIDVLDNDSVHAGSQATLESVNQPSTGGSVTIDTKGTATKTDDEVVFTSAPNFSGQTSFTYVMNDTDGTGADSTGTVIVNVAPVNDRPVARGNRYSMGEDRVLIRDAATGVLFNDFDVDGDPLTAELVLSPTNGTLQLNGDGSFQYTPNANFNGEDVFTYRAKDPTGAVSKVATVTIAVVAAPDRPEAQEKTYNAVEDTTLTVSAANGLLVGATDADGDTNLRAVRATQAVNGTVTVNADGSFTYRARANFNGVDSFNYRVVDSTGRNSIAKTVTINVAARNDRPVARADSYTTSEGANLVVSAENGVLRNDTDVDGDSLIALRAHFPQNGSVTLNSDGSFVYRPNPGFVGTDTFTYRARDNSGATNNTSGLATVTITITETNDAPTAAAQSYSGTEDEDLSVAAANGLLEGSSDPEGNPLSAVVVSQPSKGMLVSATADGAFVYRPNPNARGIDTFTYKVSDGQLDSPPETVTIAIAAVNDAPPAINDNFSVLGDVAGQVLGDVLVNDRAAFNPDGPETLSIIGFNAVTVQGGSVTLNGSGRLVYSPPGGFIGSDRFNYTVGDGNGGQASATVHLDVVPAQLNTLSGFVYRDRNENGRRDSGEAGIGDVTVRLVNTANGSVVTTQTNGNGRYNFGGVGPGTFRIEEVQPKYLIDGAEQRGSAGGVVANDRFTLNIPGTGLPNNQGVNYNFGEGNVLVGQNPNGDPPLEFTLEEILATNTNLGAMIALQGTRREWFTTLDPSWSNVVNMNVQLASDMSRLTLTIVVNDGSGPQTYRAVVLRNQPDPEALRFRVMATNNQGFQIIRLDGDLDLSEFTQVGGFAKAADAVLASW